MILVTGGSQGIGLACVTAVLRASDHDVLVTGRSADKLAAAVATFPVTQRNRIRTMVCDQAQRSHVVALIEAVLKGPDAPIGAVLNVGSNPLHVQGPRRLQNVSADAIDETIRTNCTHLTVLSASLLGAYRAQRAGTLVWVGSQAARVGMPGAAVYCATKAFLSGLCRSAAAEYDGLGVHVRLVHPGLVRTPRTSRLADAFAARHGISVASPTSVADRIVQRLLTPADSPLEEDL